MKSFVVVGTLIFAKQISQAAIKSELFCKRLEKNPKKTRQLATLMKMKCFMKCFMK